MIEAIDFVLDRVTMYRLLLYVLLGLVFAAVVLAFLGFLPFTPFSIVKSTIFIIAVSWATNTLFAKVFDAPTNIESVYLTSLILALIIPPLGYQSNIAFLGWASVLSEASKYILAIGKKHIFNPAAVAVVLTSWGFGGAASWWVGSTAMTPFVLVGGLLIARKVRREDMIFTFFAVAAGLCAIWTYLSGGNALSQLDHMVLESALLFLGFVMLTEPLTSPTVNSQQVIYAALTGILFIPQFHIASFYPAPEMALLAGNIFAYLVSPKQKLLLKLKERVQIAPDIFDSVFTSPKRLAYAPGQYMEWTLPHEHSDSRGNRRYFTLASSPTETNIRLGVRYTPQGSSYKKALMGMDDQTTIVANQVAGNFTLPKDPKVKLVFLAGGIGITPYRSMIKYLLDTKQSRPITLIYSNTKADEIVYRDVFDAAVSGIGLKAVYTLTDPSGVPPNWQGRVGRIDGQVIREEIPDYRERLFYLSGSQSMVTAMEKTLADLGISQKQIKKDFFPGLA